MHRIKVDPAQLRALSAQLQQTAGDLQGVEGRVGSALGGLAWEARQKANVDGQANHARSQALALAAQVEGMARYLERKAQAFEEADGQGVGRIRQVDKAYLEAQRQWFQSPYGPHYSFPGREVKAVTRLGTLLVDPQESVAGVNITLLSSAAGAAALAGSISSVQKGFDWKEAVDSVVGFGSDKSLELVAKKFTYQDYKSIGRFINLKVVGNQRGGWVGRMDELGHIIESPWLQKGVPFGLGVVLDEDFGSNNARAIAGEVATGAAALIPGIGLVLLASDIVQVGVALGAGGAEILGYPDTAAQLQNAFKVVDLGGYVEEIGEGVYDTAQNWIADPNQIVPDLEAAGEQVAKFGCGLIERSEKTVGKASDFIGGLFD